MKEQLLLNSDFLSSLNMVASLPVIADQKDMMGEMKSNKDWRMVCVSTIKNSECKFSLSQCLYLHGFSGSYCRTRCCLIEI